MKNSGDSLWFWRKSQTGHRRPEMHVLGLAFAGVLALTVPITGHAGGPGSVMGPANAGPAAGIVSARDDGGWSRHLGAVGAHPTAGGAFDYPFGDWRGPTGGWGNP